MKLESQVVTRVDTRCDGAGRPDKCFYCTAALGAEHDPECVCRVRSIVVRATVEYVVDIPEFWTVEQFEFHRNHSSWCAGNMLPELEFADEHGCLCHCTEIAYVREATAEDEERWGYGVKELKDRDQGKSGE